MPTKKSAALVALLLLAATLAMPRANATTVPAWRPAPSLPQVTPVWSGYVARGIAFRSVSATWAVPQITCPDSFAAFGAAWVGLGGWHRNLLAQAGVDGDCAGGAKFYWIWYEVYGDPHFGAPSAPGYPVVLVPNYPLAPHDLVHVQVSYHVGLVTFYLQNLSRHWSFVTHHRVYIPLDTLDTAEWILEAEPSCDQYYLHASCLGHLPRLASLTFFSAFATDQHGRATPLAFSRYAVTLRLPHSIARPGPLLAPGGSTFTIYSSTTPRRSYTMP